MHKMTLAAVLGTLLVCSVAGAAGAVRQVPIAEGHPWCPAAPPTTVPSRQRSGTSERLIPGVPVALMECGYQFPSVSAGSSLQLQWADLVPARKTAQALNALPAHTVAPAGPDCPSVPGLILMVAEYANGSRLLASATLGPCAVITNGDRVVTLPARLQQGATGFFGGVISP